MLNDELLDALGVKWVCCLGGQGATCVFSSPLPCHPYNTDQPCRWKLGLSSCSYKASRSSQFCAPVWHSACPCAVDHLHYQPFFFKAVFVPELPVYRLFHLLIKIKLYFKTIQTFESWQLFFAPRNLHRWANKQPYAGNESFFKTSKSSKYLKCLKI